MRPIILHTNAGKKLATSIGKIGKFPIARFRLGRFPDGEVACRLMSPAKGRTVIIIGSVFPPAENLLEILILTHTAKQLGAKKIIALIPYLGYAKADKASPSGAAITAKLIPGLLKSAGVNQVITATIHSKIAKDFFQIPIKNIDALAPIAKKLFVPKNIIIVSPDMGGAERARIFASQLGLPVEQVIVLRKKHLQASKVSIRPLRKKLDGNDCILVDDMTQSGQTLISAAKAIKLAGAGRIQVACAHIIPTGPALKLLLGSQLISHIYTTNSIDQTIKKNRKLSIISIATDLAETLKKN